MTEGIDFPPRHWTRLQKLVWTMRKHGNEPETLNLAVIAEHNSWTSADELLVEFRLQQNGSRKLPEEVFASAPKPTPAEEIEE